MKELILVFCVKPGAVADVVSLLIVSLFRLRLWCQKVISHKMFDHIVLLFIFLNCITVALERPDIHPKSMVANTHRHTFAQLNYRS